MSIELPKSIKVELPPQIRNSRNPLIEAVLLVVVCGLFYWFIVQPKQAVVSVKKAELAKIQEEAKNIQDSADKFNKMVAELGKYPKEFSDLDQAMPFDGKIPKFQLLIESMAKSVGVSIGNVTVAGRADEIWAGDKALLSNPFGATRTMQKLTGTVYVSGSFDQIYAFLKKIETSGRLINISSMSIDSGQNGDLNLKLAFDSYYLAP